MKPYNVYITTNIITGKQYVGDHYTPNIKGDNYLGSGRVIKSAIKRYGKQNFKHEILESFETKKEAFDAQEKYINIHNTLIPNGYNISPKGGIGVKDCHSDETKKKISKNAVGFKGHQHTDESKKKISKALTGISCNKGKKVSENVKMQISQSLIGRIPWNKGKKMSKEFCEKTINGIKTKRNKII